MCLKDIFLVHSSDVLNRELNINRCVALGSNVKSNVYVYVEQNYVW
jgi:hypothetical protein